MYFVEERTVGASLGDENIDRGMLAVVIGLALVAIFMIVYYKVFGVIADICLTMNMIVLVAVMSLLGATLTLPGIAGIVLTVGMAVDANVLIFSRIREELKRSPPSVAIKNGYDRAFCHNPRCQHYYALRRIDPLSHWQWTSGRIRRHVVHRNRHIYVHVDFRFSWLSAPGLRQSRCTDSLDMNFNIDFMAHRHLATVLSGVFLVASVVAFVWLGVNRGLDFTGGVLVELAFEAPVDPVYVRSILSDDGYGNAVVQSLGSETEVQVRVPPVPGIDQSNLGDNIRSSLVEGIGAADLRRSEFRLVRRSVRN